MGKKTHSASISEDVIQEIERLRKRPEISRNKSEMTEILLREALEARRKKEKRKKK